jgi:penicillin amidase
VAARALPANADPEAVRLSGVLAAWNGDYAADSTGALAWQALVDVLIERVYRPRHGDAAAARLRQSPLVHRLVAADAEAGALDAALPDALRRAARQAPADATWGDRNRLHVQHWLGHAPVIGGAWRWRDLPSAGSLTTVMKAAGELGPEPHAVVYGANARHLADLADPDGSWVVLLGGNDGWPGSAQQLDQLDAWQAGTFIQVPLRPETAARTHPHVTVVAPVTPTAPGR